MEPRRAFSERHSAHAATIHSATMTQHVPFARPMMRIVTRLRGPAALFAALFMAACNLNVDEPSRGNTNLRTPTISAKLDTVAWSDAASVTLTGAMSATPGSYSIVADGRISDRRTVRLTITMANIRGAGTYPIGVETSVPGAKASLLTSSGGIWLTLLSGDAGTLVLTEVSATRLRGTFTMSLAPQNDLAGTTPLNVTAGQFDLPVTGAGAGAVVPDNAGSRISAILGGEAFNAATASGVTSEDRMLLQGGTTTRGILIDLRDIRAPGTYAVGTTTPGAYIGVASRTAPIQDWNSNGAGSSGSVTVTTITATRLIGTFTATLAPTTGTTGALTVTNGVFDIGR
jgi:hypothetical protein